MNYEKLLIRAQANWTLILKIRKMQMEFSVTHNMDRRFGEFKALRNIEDKKNGGK